MYHTKVGEQYSTADFVFQGAKILWLQEKFQIQKITKPAAYNPLKLFKSPLHF